MDNQVVKRKPRTTVKSVSKSSVKEDGRHRTYVFTINNYTDDMIELLQKIKCKCMQFGKEVAPSTGTKHLQGWIQFSDAKTLSAVCSIFKPFNKPHLEFMKGSIEQNVKYCTKDNDVITVGVVPVAQKKGENKNTRLSEWESLDVDIQSGISMKDLMIKYPRLSGECPSGFRMHFENLKPEYEYDISKETWFKGFLPFQSKIISILKSTPCHRSIYWIYDKNGNSGKSKIVKYLSSCKEFKCIRISNGKTSDIAYCWKGEHILLDISRTSQEYINYDLIEQLKNGQIFSSKYESVSKTYDVPHVFIFSNFEPDYVAMSLDRWRILEIDKKTNDFILCPDICKDNLKNKNIMYDNLNRMFSEFFPDVFLPQVFKPNHSLMCIKMPESLMCTEMPESLMCTEMPDSLMCTQDECYSSESSCISDMDIDFIQSSDEE
nr:putative replication associated protein [Crucivirus sp.]